MMRVSDTEIRPEQLRTALCDPGAGAYAAFEGWIRDENEDQRVVRLEYEVYAPLAIKEGQRVLAEARQRYPLRHAACVHRSGLLEIGECAVWVGVTSAHRDAAFAACRYIIDQVKVRLPIWKKEHYRDGHSGWVNCERCASQGHDAAMQAESGTAAR